MITKPLWLVGFSEFLLPKYYGQIRSILYKTNQTRMLPKNKQRDRTARENRALELHFF